MSIKLGSNVLSLGLQARLSKADEVVTTTSQRLSSGLRINKGGDDAAALAISSSLQVKARVFSQGVRNLNDGVSAINITEAALDGLSNILSRIEELSMQALNGANSDKQRAVMQHEVTALQSEWNRIVESTTFNGQQLLTGSGTRLVLQGGSGTQGTVAVQFGKEALAAGVDNSAGETTRVSTSSAGAQANNSSGSSFALSADGRYVVFDSSASNLVTGDTNSLTDIFMKDTATGATTRINTSTAGIQANSSASYARVSADGRYVVFQSDATNLVTGDTNGASDIFMKDTSTGVTTLVSSSSGGVQGNSVSSIGSISADGRYVVFLSSATNLVTGDVNGQPDIFMKDTVTGVTTVVSSSSAGAQANGQSSWSAVSANGRYVAFSSDATNLVSGDTNGATDVFLKDTVTGLTSRVNTTSAGGQANGSAASIFASAISDDGRYVAFDSSASDLVTGDTNGSNDIFVKDTLTGTTTRISTDSNSNQASSSSYGPVLSADGRYVGFLSMAANLVSGDTNGAADIFVKDTLSGTTTRVSTSSAGVGGDSAGWYPAISADGRHVAFNSSATNLVSGDTNATGDIFLRDLTKAGVQTLAGMIVSNQSSAKVTLTLVDKYKNELIEYRAKIGASTSRVVSMLSTLQSDKLSYAEASSRITDADVASESATLVATTTRQRVASALLSQANLLPEIALELLKRL